MIAELAVWDGSRPGRKSLSDATAPKHDDFVAAVKQIAATQRFVITLAQNLKEIPDLPALLAKADTDIKEALTKIEALTPPASLQEEIDDLKLEVSANDPTERLNTLQTVMDGLSSRLAETTLKHAEFRQMVEKGMNSFQNEARNHLNRIQAESDRKIAELRAEVTRLSGLIDISARLTKL